MIGMINRGRIKDHAVVQEFEHLIARLRGFLSQSFDEDGELIVSDPNLAVMPVGGMAPYAGTSAPTGWQICNGDALSRVTYKPLFDVIGTAYGVGDGSTTFNIPDLRQRFPLGLAAAGTGNALGATGGAIDHVHTGPSHTHTIAADGSHSHTVANHTHSIASDGDHTHTIASDGGHTHSTGEHSHAVNGGSSQPVTDGDGSAGSIFTATSTTIFSDSGTSSDGAHDHDAATGTDGDHDHGGNTGAQNPGTDSQADHDHSGSTGASGTGNTGTANPPFVVVNYIIFHGVGL